MIILLRICNRNLWLSIAFQLRGLYGSLDEKVPLCGPEVGWKVEVVGSSPLKKFQSFLLTSRWGESLHGFLAAVKHGHYWSSKNRGLGDFMKLFWGTVFSLRWRRNPWNGCLGKIRQAATWFGWEKTKSLNIGPTKDLDKQLDAGTRHRRRDGSLQYERNDPVILGRFEDNIYVIHLCHTPILKLFPRSIVAQYPE